jgi:hypothetical protein
MTAAAAMFFSEIAIFVFVPMMVVINAATFSNPITREKLAALIMGSRPSSADVRGLSPVALMPLPMVSNGIPITVNPNEFRCRSRRHNVDHTWRRRGSYSDTDRDLSTENRAHGRNCCCEQCHHDQAFHTWSTSKCRAKSPSEPASSPVSNRLNAFVPSPNWSLRP